MMDDIGESLPNQIAGEGADSADLLGLIIEQTLRAARADDLFDDATLKALSRLAEEDDFQKVDEIIKTLTGVPDETPQAHN